MSCSEFANFEDSADDWVLVQKLRAGVIDRYSLAKPYARKDGALLWERLNVSLLKNGDGGLSPLVFAFWGTSQSPLFARARLSAAGKARAAAQYDPHRPGRYHRAGHR